MSYTKVKRTKNNDDRSSDDFLMSGIRLDTGRLLDVSIEENYAIIWIKTIDGHILKLIDSYEPRFYILPKSETEGFRLFQILSQQTSVKKASWDEKYTDLFSGIRSMKKLICVYPISVQFHRILVNKLEKDTKVVQLFNTDILHLQQYLFTKLKIEPTCKVQVEHKDSKLLEMRKIDDEET